MGDIIKELVKLLIERIKSSKVGAESLLVAALLVVTFLVAQYFETNPKAFAALHNYYLQSVAVLILSAWAAALCWRYAKIRTLRIIATLSIIVIGIASVIWIIRSSHIAQLHIRLVFDDTVYISPATMTRLIDRLQSPLFQVDMLDSAIPIHAATDGAITDDEVRAALETSNLLPSQSDANKPLPVLITGRMLEDSEWENLLMISWNDAVVISVWG